ncbi:MAG: AAA family ATPase [Bacteroidia bacterium]|nr:AAA family ATPase [Bacteroidia bacterium]
MQSLPINTIPDLDNSAFKRVLESIEQTNDSFLLTGKAGTGKSTLLRHFCKTSLKKKVVLAPTGIAAINVGGQTVHSFFGFPFRPLVQGDEEIRKYPEYSEKYKIIRSMDTLIIDEISMLRADLIDAIDHSLRINGGNAALPFGGKQVVFIGDLFQLEPVVSNTDVEYMMFNQYYKSPYFFSANIFKELKLHCLELKKVYRQSDKNFISLLNKVRLNQADWDHIEELNARHNPAFSFSQSSYAITLCTRNQVASNINDVQLEKITTPEYAFQGVITDNYNIKNLPTDHILILKTGAQVMFIKNSITGKWVNGTIGHIHSLAPDKIEVKLTNGNIEEVTREEWENKTYVWERNSRTISSKILGTFKQFPLKLAWAITIHKSQGMTFDEVVIDTAGGAFAHGQMYVALSRCRTLEGITLTNKITPRDIIVDERVVNFAHDQFIEIE